MTAKPAVAFLAVLVAVVAVLPGSSSTRQGSPVALPRRASKHRTQPEVTQAFGRLPIHFEANLSQAEPKVRFLGRGSGYALFLTADEAVLSLSARSARRDRQSEDRREASRSSVLRTRLVGANADPKVRGADELPGKANYFLGNDPRKWRRDVPLYGRVAYEGVYPGVDLVYYGNQHQLEYDFVVAPHADPHSIRMRFEGARSLSLDAIGDLRIALEQGEVVHHAPKVRQRSAEGREAPVEGRWSISGLGASLELGPYDSSRELVIDPVLVYSTYLGGSEGDSANSIAVDGSGAAYVAGVTSSADFPTVNPYQGSLLFEDAFVAKLSLSGQSLVYATYLGGNSGESAEGIAVDASGSAYVTGMTQSSDFPVRNPLLTNQGGEDGFALKLSPAGDDLIYSTYLGGSDVDSMAAIAADASGHAYITGNTRSSDFPMAGPQEVRGGEADAVVLELSPTGDRLLFSVLLGGTRDDSGTGVAVDSSENVYVAGCTASSDFPVRNPLQTAQGGEDGFLTRLSHDGSVTYSTYLGGQGWDCPRSIAVDGLGQALVTGETWSTDFPTVNAYTAVLTGLSDAFVARVSPSGSSLVFSTYLGGTGDERAWGIGVDGAGNVYVVGDTSSSDFPVQNPLQGYGGVRDAFLVQLEPTGDRLRYSTFLGGGAWDAGYSLAVDGAGGVYVTGLTESSDFPTRQPLQPARGLYDAFIVKIAPPPPTDFYTVTPCRVVDTRKVAGPLGGPALAAGADRFFAMAGQCDIPQTARGVALNLTVIEPTAQGHLRVYPKGGGMPPTSTLNYSTGQTRAGNGVFMLGVDGAIAVRCSQPSGTAHLVVDVSGYFQ